ncbi:MAG: D-alanyl-D-alanine carboxypeptidase [Rhizobiales bacterium]|nr:D-alanyl-D-alanine carboxypeptidase [Hyphomicrobiales bacterium]
MPWLRSTAAAAAMLIAATAVASAQSRSADKKDEGSRTSAPQAILIEADSGSVLFERNADEPVRPASLAKLMTAEYVFNEIKQGRLKLDDEFTISEDAWRRGGAPSRTSSMFAAVHSKVRVEDLLRSVIIQSGNDASIALAEGIAGNERTFAERMTKRANELGLTKSRFMNATGLPDPDQRVTVRELAKLAQHVIQTYPVLYKMYGEREFTWNKIRQYNRNPLIPMSIGADGLKTGYLKDAGYGLVGSAVHSGLRLIVVITGLKSANERAAEGRKLLEWGFRSFQSRMLFAEGQTIAEAKVYGGAMGRVPLVPAKAVRIMLPRNTNDKIIARVVYTGPVPAPVRAGQPIGRLKVWRNDAVTLEAPLQAGADVEAGNLSQRAFDAATELVITVFRAGADRL